MAPLESRVPLPRPLQTPSTVSDLPFSGTALKVNRCFRSTGRTRGWPTHPGTWWAWPHVAWLTVRALPGNAIVETSSTSLASRTRLAEKWRSRWWQRIYVQIRVTTAHSIYWSKVHRFMCVFEKRWTENKNLRSISKKVISVLFLPLLVV